MISGKGGKVAHAMGVAHKWDQKSAQIAGSLGGKKTHQIRKAARDKEKNGGLGSSSTETI